MEPADRALEEKSFRSMNRLGYKTEAYNIRQIPALYIYSNRTRINTSAVR